MDGVTGLLQDGRPAKTGAAEEALAAAKRALLGVGGPRTLGRYVLAERLGTGGLGVVYRAHDPELHRDVAVKVIRAAHVGRDPEEAGARLAREARALARLAHPNVVEIYDWGTADDGTFYLVMELIDGPTVASWLDARPRTVGEILAVYRAAAAGLIAAHERGLVHRDFKPTNVMIGSDGRVRVLDFGLARAPAADPVEEDVDTAAVPTESSADAWVTATNNIMGTPLFMAPEQHRGESADEHADQFAFCVALWVALFQRVPFIGASPHELAVNKSAGRLRWSRRRGVPRSVRRALAIGLRPEPRTRHASMAALLRHLQPRPRWPWLAAGVGATALAIALAASGTHETCDASTVLLPTWNDDVREALRASLSATDVPYAASTAQAVIRSLDARLARWSTAYDAACETTAAEAEGRRRCLQADLAAIDGRLQLLRSLDARSIEHAIRLADDLPEPGSCDQGGGRSAELAAALSEATGAVSLEQAARARQAMDTVASLARREHDPATLATVRELQGRLSGMSGDLAGARAHLEDALRLAVEAHRPDLEATLLARLTMQVGVHAARHDEAEVFAQRALTLVDRLMGDPRIRAQVWHCVAALRLEQGRFEDAIDSAQQGLDALAEMPAAVTDGRTRLLTTRGRALKKLRRLEEARATFSEVQVELAEHYGATHPLTLRARLNEAIGWMESGEPERALPAFEEVYRARLAIYSANSVEVAQALDHIGQAKSEAGRATEAVDDHGRALAIVLRTLGPLHPSTAAVRTNLGEALTRAGRPLEALEHLHAAAAAKATTLGPNHPDLVFSTKGLAHAYEVLGMPELAAAYEARAQELGAGLQ